MSCIVKAKKSKKNKRKLHILRRQIYQAKRRTRKYKVHRLKGIIQVGNADRKRNLLKQAPEYQIHKAPKRFSFIDQTNDCIKYFQSAGEYFKSGRDVFFDISDISSLTIDAITLLAAYLGDDKFRSGKHYAGNAPNNLTLKKLFSSSGFYDYVSSKGKKDIDPDNQLFRFKKENTPNSKFAAEISDAAVEFSYEKKKNTFELVEIQLRDEIYNLLVEAMSNTNHHASKVRGGKNWWIFMQRSNFTGIFSVCLIDLGIGIFESANFKRYRTFISNFYQGNYFLIDDFLKGQIYSSITNDPTRGKGVKQIIESSNRDEMKCLWIISNDVKFEVKSGRKESLDYNFRGTCIYFEIEKMF